MISVTVKKHKNSIADAADLNTYQVVILEKGQAHIIALTPEQLLHFRGSEEDCVINYVSSFLENRISEPLKITFIKE